MNILQNSQYKVLWSIVFILVLVVLATSDMTAQCPMCKMSAESNMKDGGTMGRGLNMGILFLLSLPYIMVGTLGYIWYRNRKNYDANTEGEKV